MTNIRIFRNITFTVEHSQVPFFQVLKKLTEMNQKEGSIFFLTHMQGSLWQRSVVVSTALINK